MKTARLPIKPMYLSVDMEATGINIKRLVKNSGYTTKEIMEITGLTTEQAVYKWYRGASIPSTEVQLILCRLLNIGIEELLVINEELLEGDLHNHYILAA